MTSSCWRGNKSRASRRGRPPVPEDALALTSCPCPSSGPDFLSLGTPGCVALISCPRGRWTGVALSCCPWRHGIGVILTRRLLGLKLQLSENQKAAADTCWSTRLGRPGQSFVSFIASLLLSFKSPELQHNSRAFLPSVRRWHRESRRRSGRTGKGRRTDCLEGAKRVKLRRDGAQKGTNDGSGRGICIRHI